MSGERLFQKCGVCGREHGVNVPQSCAVVRELADAIRSYVLGLGPSHYTPQARRLLNSCERIERGDAPPPAAPDEEERG